MKNKLFFFFAFLLVLAGLERANANDIDTVWMRWMPHGHYVSSVRFSPDDSKIAAFSTNNNAVAIVDVADGSIDTVLKGFNSGEYTPDGQFIISFKGRLIYKIKTSDYSYSSPFDTASSGISSFSMSDNGFIVCKTGNGFQVWDAKTNKIIKSKYYEQATEYRDGIGIQGIKITNDGKYLLLDLDTAYINYKNQRTTIESYCDILEFETLDLYKREHDIYNFFPSNSGEIVVLIYTNWDDEKNPDRKLFVKNIQTGEILLTLYDEQTFASDIAFSPDDKYMAVAYLHQSKIEIWDLINEEIKYIYQPGGYGSVDISTNLIFLVGSISNSLVLWPFDSKINVIEENQIQASITYPNPTQGIFNLEFDLIQNNMTTIDMIDLTGQVVKIIDNNFLLSGHQFYQVDITDLPAGMYTLRILSGNYSFNSSIIKN
jgi:WD40 repeat protein